MEERTALDQFADGDTVSSIVDAWRARLPDLDPSPLLILGRVQRLAAMCDPLLRPPFAAARLAPGDFDVLAALRRSAPPHALSNGDLARATLVTPGGVTKRIDRLAAAGLVTRTRDPADARGRVVALTEAGRQLADELIRVHMANESAIIGALDGDEQHLLASLLGKLLASVEAGRGS
ncbi:MarR family winged helix-turn-helix transcriptional regulator [Actinoallomurus iriomotensis]|uniref:MarR family transcriptional regulator n=1 Tax=Actinoallomurus iriomotensis TaxID=478107 RepID=A0A9W6SBU2_9ACTN|nr:MarR family transcriptional regulator [Actinoallomurus iriomotensis]GLY89367.1 MarR family transcriptional regulator [Actinoallomurus iriomotensis]